MATRRSLRDMQTAVDTAPTIWLGASANFSGGMDTATDPRDIDPLQVQLVQNGYVALSNRAVRRPGFSSMLDAPFENAIRASTRFKSPDGTINALVVWEGRNIWEVHDDGTMRMLARDDLTAETGRIPLTHYAEEVYFSSPGDGLLGIKQATAAESAYVHVSGGNITGSVNTAGSAGNVYTVALVAGAPSGALAVALSGTDITVTLACDAQGVPISTVAEVESALDLDASISAVTTWNVVGATGAEIAEVTERMAFIGGADIGDLVVDWSMTVPYDFSFLCTRHGGERLFGIDADDEATLRWSDALTPGTWGTANLWRPGGRFTGLIEIQGVLIAMQEERILRIDGTDPTTWETSRAMAEGLGLPHDAQDSLRELEGIAVYLSQSGLTVYDGSRPRVISNAVKCREQACRNFIPLTVDEWEGSFTELWGDFLLVFYRSDSGLIGCDRVLLYDFRRSIFAGVWLLPTPVIGSLCDETSDGDAARLILVTASGDLFRENDSYLDAGEPFEFKVRTKVYDFGRETLDKQVIEMRSRYYAGGATTLGMSLFKENDTGTPVISVTHTITGEGEGTIIKRVPHVRGYDFFVEFSQTDDVYLEVSGSELDAFFAARR